MKYRVIYPRGRQTGGPEALHQLVAMLREEGADAALVPTPDSLQFPRVPAYERYDAPEVADIDDEPGVLVVGYETRFRQMLQYRQASRAIWWLSVDNSSAFSARTAHARARRFPHDTARTVRNWFRDFSERAAFNKSRNDLRTTFIHLSQSDYAHSYLRANLGVESRMLSDYTTVHNPLTEDQLARKGLTGRVAYNPSRCAWEVRQIAKQRPDLDFVPISGMTAAEVRATLEACDVYIDLGNHPGKDRMPREAALAGCVVLVSTVGSGGHFKDVPIADQFKIDMGKSAHAFLPAALAALGGAMQFNAESRTSQSGYRQVIRAEYTTFRDEVRSLLASTESR